MTEPARDDNFDYQKFQQWAFQMLRSGRCILRQCVDHRDCDGPTCHNEQVAESAI